jgi:hypothetical protein
LIAITQAFGVLLLATSLAFIISNTSFYLLSSKVLMPTWAQYLDVFASYYPAYLLSTLAYGVVMFMVGDLLSLLRTKLHPVTLPSEQS